MASSSFGQTADHNAALKLYELPTIKSSLLKCEVLNDTTTLITLNAGLFCPENNSWYHLDSSKLTFGISFFQKQELMGISYCDSLSSSIVLYSDNKIIKTINLREKGLYDVHIISADSILYYGISSKKAFIVNLLTGETETNLIKLEKNVDDVFIDNTGFIYLLLDNNIFIYKQGFKPRLIFSLTDKIYGFTIDQNNNLYISKKEGIFKYSSNTASLILPRAKGRIYIFDHMLYVIEVEKNSFIKYRLIN